MQAPDLTRFRITFDEEFNSFLNSPDGSTGTWMTSYPYSGSAARTLSGNSEGEYYSDASVGTDPFTLASGVLGITAEPAAPGSNPGNLPYTSGVITTNTSFSQTYGYFETRARLPAGQGLWPAFWLLPASNAYTAELDVFEVLGHQPDIVFSSVHGAYGGVWATDIRGNATADTSDGFHTFGVDWEPDTTSFYLDGTLLSTAATPDSMNAPMFMLLNLAVGNTGSWPGAPSAGTAFPATMQLDYVRAYATANTSDVSGAAAITAPDTTVTLGSGPNTLTLSVAEDAWQGDARFTVTIDGQQFGGAQTVTASHTAGAVQLFTFKGDFGAGRHGVVVNFLNDAYGGPDNADRNLFVVGAALDGLSLPGATLSLFNTGRAAFSFGGAVPEVPASPPPAPISLGAGADTLQLRMSEDAWQGNAQFTIGVDGQQIGGVQTVTAARAAGAVQLFNVRGNFGSGSHVAVVNFLNDAYGGTDDTDRNLLIAGATLNGVEVPGAAAALTSGAQSFAFTGTSSGSNTPVPPTPTQLQIQAYDWRSHALLSGLSVWVLGQGSAAGAISLKSVHLDASGRLVAEIWADAGSGAQNFGFALRLSNGGVLATAAAASFHQSTALGGDWAIGLNSGEGQLNLSAIAASSTISGATNLGTLTFTLPQGASALDVSLVAGEVGAAAAAPFTLSYAGVTTGADGSATAANVASGNYSITATRSASDVGRAITSADALAALRIAVGLNPNAAPDAGGRVAAPQVSPYQLLAADVNGDGRVTAADALAILRMAVKLPGVAAPKWIFVDEAASTWDPATLKFVSTRSSVTPAAPAVASVTTEARVSLVGVLTGAVLGRYAPLDSIGSALPPDRYESLPTSHFQALSQAGGTPLDQWGYGAAISASALGDLPLAGGGLPASSVVVYDSAAHIAAALDRLQDWDAAGRLNAVIFMETTTPVVALSAAQLARDTGALSRASGVFRLDIGAGANTASTSLSGAAVMTILGAPDLVPARSQAASIHYALAPASGVETIAGFRYGTDRLDIDLAGRAAADLQATDIVLAGQSAIALSASADPAHAVVLTGSLAGAAELMSHHLVIASGHALIG
jgi:beta-glucanase (GH16 family)